jgi:hypothetical protein
MFRIAALPYLSLVLLTPACAGPARRQSVADSRPAPSWVGCYVVQHLGARQHLVDSLQLVAEGPAIDSQQTGFSRVFHYEGDSGVEFGNRLFIGPAWRRTKGDSITIAEGILSGWYLEVYRYGNGFTGWYSLFSDVLTDPTNEDSVLGVRVACPPKRAA